MRLWTRNPRRCGARATAGKKLGRTASLRGPGRKCECWRTRGSGGRGERGSGAGGGAAGSAGFGKAGDAGPLRAGRNECVRSGARAGVDECPAGRSAGEEGRKEAPGGMSSGGWGTCRPRGRGLGTGLCFLFPSLGQTLREGQAPSWGHLATEDPMESSWKGWGRELSIASSTAWAEYRPSSSATFTSQTAVLLSWGS